MASPGRSSAGPRGQSDPPDYPLAAALSHFRRVLYSLNPVLGARSHGCGLALQVDASLGESRSTHRVGLARNLSPRPESQRIWLLGLAPHAVGGRAGVWDTPLRGVPMASGKQNVDLPPMAMTVKFVVEVALAMSRVCVRCGKLGAMAGPRTERRSVIIAPRRIDTEALAVRLRARGACPVSTGITDTHGRHCTRQWLSLQASQAGKGIGIA